MCAYVLARAHTHINALLVHVQGDIRASVPCAHSYGARLSASAATLILASTSGSNPARAVAITAKRGPPGSIDSALPTCTYGVTVGINVWVYSCRPVPRGSDRVERLYSYGTIIIVQKAW